MVEGPHRDFGQRKPATATAPAAAPVKRSRHVALLLMGTVAVGAGAYATVPRSNCEPTSPETTAPAQTGSGCSARGSSSSGGHAGSWPRSNFYGGDSASGSPSTGKASDAASGGTTRGGFGSFARAVASHFSGGG